MTWRILVLKQEIGGPLLVLYEQTYSTFTVHFSGLLFLAKILQDLNKPCLIMHKNNNMRPSLVVLLYKI